jgi:hypothetical protein
MIMMISSSTLDLYTQKLMGISQPRGLVFRIVENKQKYESSKIHLWKFSENNADNSGSLHNVNLKKKKVCLSNVM